MRVRLMIFACVCVIRVHGALLERHIQHGVAGVGFSRLNDAFISRLEWASLAPIPTAYEMQTRSWINNLRPFRTVGSSLDVCAASQYTDTHIQQVVRGVKLTKACQRRAPSDG